MVKIKGLFGFFLLIVENIGKLILFIFIYVFFGFKYNPKLKSNRTYNLVFGNIFILFLVYFIIHSCFSYQLTLTSIIVSYLLTPILTILINYIQKSIYIKN